MAPDFKTYASCLGEFIREALPFAASGRPPSDARFNSLALHLFRLQFEHVPPYRRLCEARGLGVSAVRRWSDIPCVPAAAFKDLDLTSLSSFGQTRVFHSSGTTLQRPSRHFHDAESLAVYEHSLLSSFRYHLLSGLEPPVQLISLTPSPALAPHSSLAYMFDTVRREMAQEDSVFVGTVDEAGAWTLDLPSACRTLNRAAASGRPVVVLGTAFSFLQLLGDPAASPSPSSMAHRPHRFALPPDSRVLETGGYKGRTRELPKIALHQLITDRLGISSTHLVSEYGMSELSSQAYDHTAGQPLEPGGRVFRFPPWARAVLVSPEAGRCVGEGETGLIRVFDLANVHSVLAIQTEDLGVRRDGGFEFAARAAEAEARGCSLLTL